MWTITPAALSCSPPLWSSRDLNIYTASDPEAGLDLIFEKHPQIVLTDLVMPKMTGLDLLERVMLFDPAIEVILMTAHYSSESAVEAIRKGASDYLNKPVSLPALRERIGTMIEDARRRMRTTQIEDELVANSPFEQIIGASPAMWEMYLAHPPHCAAFSYGADHGPDRDPAKIWWRRRCID